MIVINQHRAQQTQKKQQNSDLMHSISLRERKQAQTKVALARAAMERLRKHRLDEISVKELCETIPISEVTFYKYFPQKTDLLLYITKLWQLEMGWNMQNLRGEKSNIEIIEEFFDYAARAFEEYPFVMREALTFFIQQRGEVCFGEMSMAEKLIAYPELIGIENIPIPDNPKKEKALLPYIKMAIESGELPRHLNVEEVYDMVDLVFIGTLMSLHKNNSIRIRPMCRKMLKVLWHGLRSGILDESGADEVKNDMN